VDIGLLIWIVLSITLCAAMGTVLAVRDLYRRIDELTDDINELYQRIGRT